MTIAPPSGQSLEPFTYDDFQGVDSSRDVASLDTGQKQHLSALENGYANFRGIIIRDRAVLPRTTSQGDRLIQHVTFFGRNLAAWAQRDAGGVTLKAEPNGLESSLIYPKNSIVSSTVFNNKLIFFSRGQSMQTYDGLTFKTTANPREKPAFGVAIQRRLAIAGGLDRRTIVDFSQVDSTEIWSRDEDESSNNVAVTKASDINITNIIGTADEITGLGVFETSRLAVFTNDRTLIYTISPDYTKWSIDDKAAISVGCCSHNSIANVGTDILFCSRSGVHSLRRSESNGITIYSVPLSSKIEELYKQLFASVANKEDINAFYDSDYGQYHVFFPQNDQTSVRLTMTISPSPDIENKWSTCTFLNQRCGAALGGSTVIGTAGGLFTMQEYESTSTTAMTPVLSVTTPILWHGPITTTKQAREFILQASGKGELEIDCYNEEGKKFHSMTIPLQPTGVGDDNSSYLMLSRQYNRPFHYQYKGVQFVIKAKEGTGRVKIIGLAVMVEVPPKRKNA